eukprot:TRINITY_DN56088_c0_g1_i1.p1 TRINITY_DN56088_c0_g1~~TRINITY_DN56088_c0_g1_i1.p1  ORF type:complete len:1045 (+),score=175.22 TRINITY_DN56088_c0_g1_i1:48-3182(+)
MTSTGGTRRASTPSGTTSGGRGVGNSAGFSDAACPMSPPTPPCVSSAGVTSEPRRKPLTDEEVLFAFDEFLYHGEIRDFLKAQHSFERISSSLDTEDFDALIPPCLEVLEFSNQFIRNDTMLCLLYISLGCTLGDAPCDILGPAMRRHAAVLARHDALPMFVRSLDFLLGLDVERPPPEDGMVEKEFRLIFNCIYLQVLFNEHDEGFVRSLELGQGRLGASLVTLLFEATKMCADNERIPIKKVTLLLLRVLQCLLDVPDSLLYPMPNPSPEHAASSPAGWEVHALQPQVREFQSFTALHLHERNMIQKYSGFKCPAAIEEGLEIIQRYKDDFIMNYKFHPSEIAFMQNTPFLRDVYLRYEQLRIQGMALPSSSADETAPRLPDDAEAEQWAAKSIPAALGSLATVGGTLVGDQQQQQQPSRREKPAISPWSSSASSSAASIGSEASDDEARASVFSEAASAAETVVAAEGHSGGDVTSGGASCTNDDGTANATIPRSDYACGGEDGNGEDILASLDGCVGGGANQASCAASDSAGDASDRPVNDVNKSTTRQERGQRRRKPLLPVQGPEEDSNSPEEVFRRLYLAIFPRLTETVVLLLRLLLTSCSNVENYPGVIDMSRERHATHMREETAAERAQLAAFEKVMPSDAERMHRHRDIMAAAVSGVILILLKQARKAVSEQFSSLAQLITDSNGALVVLKFLNQDLSAAMEPRDPFPVMSCLHGRRQGAGTGVPSWPACATLRLVEVLYLLCKDSPERVRKYLIHYRAPFILKRLHRMENLQVQGLVLKLLKKQVRYLPRKWKQTNMKAISSIYSHVPTSPLEDWLLIEPFGETATEGPSQADIRANNVVYNSELLRHLSEGTAPLPSNGRPAAAGPRGISSLEGHVAAMRALRPDGGVSPRGVAASNGSLAATAAGVMAAGGASPLDGGGSALPIDGPWDGAAAVSTGNGTAAGPRVTVGGSTVCGAAASAGYRSGTSSCVSLGVGGACSRSIHHDMAGEGVAGTSAGVPHGVEAVDALFEELGDEVQDYARMFPEYVPPGCA